MKLGTMNKMFKCFKRTMLYDQSKPLKNPKPRIAHSEQKKAKEIQMRKTATYSDIERVKKQRIDY